MELFEKLKRGYQRKRVARITGKAEEKRIFKQTLFEEKKKYAGEKAKIKVERIREKARERARTPFPMRVAKGLSKIGEGLSQLPLPRIRDDLGMSFDSGFDQPKRRISKRKSTKKQKYAIVGGKAYPLGKTKEKKSKKRGRGGLSGFGDFDLGF